MKVDRILKQERFYYASPWLFAAACVLLALIIGAFAVNNYRREKALMSRALAQEGAAILNLVSSGARASLRRGVLRGDLNRDNWLESIQQVLENSAEHPSIIALFLVDQEGVVRAHTDSSKRGNTIDPELLHFLSSIKDQGGREGNRMVQPEGGGGSFFQVASVIEPLAFAPGFPPHMREMMRGRFGRGPDRQSQAIPSDLEAAWGDLSKATYYLVADLDMADFRQAVSKQRMQIGILALVLLLVGIGGLLSIATLQGLRGSQVRLKRIRAFNDVLVSSLPIGIVAMGPDRTIRTCNQSAARMLNVSVDGIEGEKFDMVMPRRLLDQFGDELEKGGTRRWDLRLSDTMGAIKSLHVSSLELDDPDPDYAGTILLIQDLSQLRDLENELKRVERDATLGRMAAGVAHELRNPLSSIKGLALLLRTRFEQDPTATETTDVLIEEVERLNRSISELLEYARPVPLNLENVDFDAVVGKAVTLIKTDADAAGIAIEEDYQCAPQRILVDQDKLVQVILNLCLNSIQALGPDGRLYVGTRLADDMAVLEVTDNGSGISPEMIEKVFQPYFTSKPNGTGLGLAMSQKIVEDLRGTIQLTSRVGSGTTVIVRLPFQEGGGSSDLP